MHFKSFVDVAFYLHERDAFQELVESQGFEVLNLYGDYSHGAFDQDGSAFMVWVLGKKEAPGNRLEQTG
jgi:hypothetical protein